LYRVLYFFLSIRKITFFSAKKYQKEHFFENNENYYDGKITNNLETDSKIDKIVINFINMIKNNTRNADDRRYTIEIQTVDNIHLNKDNVISIIIPDIYRDDPLITEGLINTGCELIIYEWNSITTKEDNGNFKFDNDIYNEVKELYENKGYLKKEVKI